MRRIVCPVEVGEPELDLLTGALWLADGVGNRIEIGRAIARLLADMARHGR
jgi:hypothetical protein